MTKIIDWLMRTPGLYNFVQWFVGGRGHERIKQLLVREIIDRSGVILDQGCGTGNYAELFEGGYVGIDVSPTDIKYAALNHKGKFLTMDAADLSFKDGSFEAVFAVGLHHHLDENKAKKAIREAVRVVKKGGKIIVVDAILPLVNWNILGWVARKLDRGGRVRSLGETQALFKETRGCKFNTLSGFPLDYLVVVIEKVS